MTTTVTVKAHAGFPVEVRQIYLREDGKQDHTGPVIILPESEQTFYAHSGMDILVREVRLAHAEISYHHGIHE
jgi:hypothetical protein